MDNYTNAARNSRDCSPRLSKSPGPEDPWPEGWETPVQTDEEWTEESKIEVKKAYDTLIQMGGRPTRPIRFNPRWKKVLIHGELCYVDFEEVEVLFYDGSKPDKTVVLTESQFIAHHWAGQARQFEAELQRWQGFLDVQQWRREHRPARRRGDADTDDGGGVGHRADGVPSRSLTAGRQGP